MTNKDIDQFIAELSKQKGTTVRQLRSKNNPTKQLTYRYTGFSHTPHLEVDVEDHTNFYEFERNYSPSKLSELLMKWIMISIRAKMLSGKFYLVVRERDKLKFAQIIKEKSLDVELIVLTS